MAARGVRFKLVREIGIIRLSFYREFSGGSEAADCPFGTVLVRRLPESDTGRMQPYERSTIYGISWISVLGD